MHKLGFIIFSIFCFKSVAFSYAQPIRYIQQTDVAESGQLVAMIGKTNDLKSGQLLVVDRKSGSEILRKQFSSTPSNVKFISDSSIFVGLSGTTYFEILDISGVRVSCTLSGEESGQALISADNKNVVIVTSKEISLVDAVECKVVQSRTWDSGDRSKVIPLKVNYRGSEFVMWSKTKHNDVWREKIWRFNSNLEPIQSIEIPDTDNSEPPFRETSKVVFRPGSDEVWILENVIGHYTNRDKFQTFSIDLLTETFSQNTLIGPSAYSGGSNLVFSQDGQMLIATTGWDLVLLKTSPIEKVKFVSSVGCKIFNPKFCTSWDSMTANFLPNENKILVFGDGKMGELQN